MLDYLERYIYQRNLKLWRILSSPHSFDILIWNPSETNFNYNQSKKQYNKGSDNFEIRNLKSWKYLVSLTKRHWKYYLQDVKNKRITK